MSNKPILCVDFDGVVHSYERGWQDGKIYGTVVPGFFEWAERVRNHFNIAIYSSPSKTETGRREMAEWLSKRLNEAIEKDELPATFDRPAFWLSINLANEKPPAWLTIDDRAIRFDGDWTAPELAPEALRSFQPWTNRKKHDEQS